MTEKGSYIRLGTAAEPMSIAMIDKLYANRTRNSIGKMRSHRQDLTFEQLRIYYDERGKTLNDQFLKSLELLTEDGKLNYAAYLLADENNISIKVAKYKGYDRVDLIENNEYGHCSLIKATKSVLDKINLENRTTTKITAKERLDKRLWNPVALREAIINSIIHNMFSRELAPKFEIFADRIEITSVGTLPDGLSEEEFFSGVSIPRNRELMRVFHDLELVEQLGSGIPRILRSYGRECFRFMDNFTRLTFPASALITPHDTPHDGGVTPHDEKDMPREDYVIISDQVKQIVEILDGQLNRQELQGLLGLSDRKHFRMKYLNPAIKTGLIKPVEPYNPKNKNQRYELTSLGNKVKNYNK